MRELDDLPVVSGTRVLLRVDLNVPLRNGVVTDDLRLRSIVPTVQALREKGARVVLMSHLGRPKGRIVPALSLSSVLKPLESLLDAPVALLPGVIGPEVEKALDELESGTVALLENLRFHPGEEKNDPDFAAALGRLGDVYVNDAFGACHRHHASVDAVCDILPEHGMGLLVAAEVAAFSRLLVDPPSNFVALLGGAKVSDKLAVVYSLLKKVDTLLIGGAMCFTFALAQGGTVGSSLVEKERVPDVLAALDRAAELGKEILLPIDVVCAAKIKEGVPTVLRPPGEVPVGEMGLDIGPETVRLFKERIARANAVLWNGPMGVFETPPFDAGTRAVAEAFAAAPGFTVAGGGDSAAALRKMGLAQEIGHLSTGGGASLELLEKGDLPGLEALRR